MSNETQVVWEKESDAKLSRSLGGVPNSVMHTVKNDQEVMNVLKDGQGVLFKVQAERLHAETENGTRLTKEYDFPSIPNATIIAVQDRDKQVSLVFDKQTEENLKQRQQEQGRSR